MPTIRIPRDDIPWAPAVSLRWPDKAPGTVDDYVLDLLGWLHAAKVSAAYVSVAEESAASIALQALSVGRDVRLRLGGGTPATEYEVAWSIFASDGRRLDLATPLFVNDTAAAAQILLTPANSKSSLADASLVPAGALCANGAFFGVNGGPGAASFALDLQEVEAVLGTQDASTLPTSADGLQPGQYYRNGSYICVVTAETQPIPVPTSADGLSAGRIWLNGSFLCVA